VDHFTTLLVRPLPYFGGSTDPVQRSIFKEKIGGEVRIPREVLKEIRKIKRKSEKRGKNKLRRKWSGK